MHILMTNPQSGETKAVKQGFSWVLFLFSPFYGLPLFMRGLHVHGAIVAAFGILCVVVSSSPDTEPLVPLVGLLLLGAMFYYGFKGNELTLAHLTAKGWHADGGGTANAYSAHPASQPGAVASSSAPSGAGTSDEKACPRCAESVKAAAVVCKHCGFHFAGGAALPSMQPEKGQRKLLKGIGIAAAIVVGLAVIGAMIEPENQPSAAAIDTSDPNSSVAALPVTAGELFAAYNANEQAAQMKYGAQPLEISGSIASIELDAADEPMVALEAGEMFEEVVLHFHGSFADTAAQLQKGQLFTARCERVSELLGFPQLNECALVNDQ